MQRLKVKQLFSVSQSYGVILINSEIVYQDDIPNLEQHLVMLITLDDLRRFTVARNFFTPTTLKRALHRMGFVQADPIRAPARAQDLILRHRVKNYHAGDLERRYATLDIEEDFFVIYGFVTRSLQALMHPRSDSRVPADDVGRPWPTGQRKKGATPARVRARTRCSAPARSR